MMYPVRIENLTRCHQNDIDQDQDALWTVLDFPRATNLLLAERMYSEGGFSRSYAQVKLTNDGNGVSVDFPKGTVVVGESTAGKGVTLTTMDNVAVGDTVIRLLYPVSDDQATHGRCRVGALPELGFQITQGCLNANGTLQFANSESPYPYIYAYEYSVLHDNNNDRTLKKLSANAEDEMLLCGERCPHRTFEKFFDYYMVPDYGDRWVRSAIHKKKTLYARGDGDFRGYNSGAQLEAVRHGSVYLNVWMYVIRKLEGAIDICLGFGDSVIEDEAVYAFSGEHSQDAALHSWDQAVAFYTGSREGSERNGTGRLMHAVADIQCAYFKTCGNHGIDGLAMATSEIFEHFDKGQALLMVEGERDCNALQAEKEIIENKMAIPLVQGAIMFAYIRERQKENEANQAHGATFAASVLPLVHYCSPGDAQIIYENMKVGSGKPDFVQVKSAFERNYQCMGITCSDVGGYYDSDSDAYFPDASPCHHTSSEGGNGKAVGLGIVFGLIVPVLVLGAWYFLRRKRRKNVDTEHIMRGPPKDAFGKSAYDIQ
jgi:hypothetical protein